MVLTMLVGSLALDGVALDGLIGSGLDGVELGGLFGSSLDGIDYGRLVGSRLDGVDLGKLVDSKLDGSVGSRRLGVFDVGDGIMDSGDSMIGEEVVLIEEAGILIIEGWGWKEEIGRLDVKEEAEVVGSNEEKKMVSRARRGWLKRICGWVEAAEFRISPLLNPTLEVGESISI